VCVCVCLSRRVRVYVSLSGVLSQSVCVCARARQGTRPPAARQADGRLLPHAGVGLYTILPSPILYGVWHTKVGSVGGRILRNGHAIVLQ